MLCAAALHCASFHCALQQLQAAVLCSAPLRYACVGRMNCMARCRELPNMNHIPRYIQYADVTLLAAGSANCRGYLDFLNEELHG